MTIRRTLTLLSAVAMTTGALAVGAPTASGAELSCNTTVGGPFDGTQVCVFADVTDGTMKVPYSVGSICAAGQCTPALDGELNIPRYVNEQPVQSYGTLCVPSIKEMRICRSFTTDDLYPSS